MKLVVGIAALATLALAGAAVASHKSALGGPRIFGGGRLDAGCTEPAPSPPVCAAHARFFSLDVHAGHGSLLYGRKDAGAAGGFRAQVTCARRDEVRSVVGGIIRRPASTPPLYFLFYVVDNAAPGVQTRDQASLLHIFDREHPDAPIPAAFPLACPASVTSPDGYVALDGDVVVG